jgi:copper(I)-binding protein
VSRSITSIRSAALGIACAVALAGCGAGQITQTDTQLASVDGASATVGQVAVRDTSIVFAESRNAAVHGTGGSAPLQGRIVNFGAVEDKLAGASSPVAASVQVSGSPVIASGRTLVITGQAPAAAESSAPASASATPSGSAAPSATPSATATSEPTATAAATASAEPLPAGTTSTTIVLTGLKQDIRPGLTYPVVFRFEKAGEVTVQVPVANSTAPRSASAEGGSGTGG